MCLNKYYFKYVLGKIQKNILLKLDLKIKSHFGYLGLFIRIKEQSILEKIGKTRGYQEVQNKTSFYSSFIFNYPYL